MSNFKHILVVDDDEIARETICNSLEDSGYVIDQACNGAEAKEKLLGEDYAVVICDIRMPEMDGITLLRKIKKNKDVPFIFVTGYPGDATEEEILEELKPFGFLVKPFDHKSLRLLVDNAAKHYEFTQRRKKLLREMEEEGNKRIQKYINTLKYIT
ncbi:MAG: hypothetical protein A2149_05630 [Candidatus Schekmanbacteria bacterium RBG_16_38_11]|uniref:Response regulatory domain-containing protein n=2 Tax=Candidatus Schekmaniibacteriota TaxID=1817811 RepID=A0A1F7RBG4_9BACT|nr:MAG: hypothetical protein A2042_02605 [Candidatus Schekmanbacteria bacterium GWA2_38_11]OGL46635.1 MAG: hypothetical protein A2149_05630 [Candidatus Schekmanbacteria bacterium RBG_16_38_11]